MRYALGLKDDMEVVLFYEDPAEEFEVTARLLEPKGPSGRWTAQPDWNTKRQIRG